MIKRKLFTAVVVVLALTFCSSTVGAIASFSAKSSTINGLSIASVRGEIDEQYEQGQTVFPGATVSKVVNVKNTGTVDCIVRVRIDKSWGENDPGGIFTVDPSLPTDNIHLNVDTYLWQYDNTDGYYYYLGVLAPGETTAEPLLRSFGLDAVSDNEYQSRQAHIDVHMECVQADGGGASAWGKTMTQLGISYTPAAESEGTSLVRYKGSKSGFSFTPSSGDLFVNFKNLVPGESRSQSITVQNESGSATELFFWAETTTQTTASSETSELIDQMLKQYADITITTDSGKLIYSGPVWGGIDKESNGNDSMKYAISLGTLSTGSAEHLKVNLSLSPDMDNQYQSLLGLVKWVFAASGGSSTAFPNTGDTSATPIILYILSSVSGTSLFVMLIFRKVTEKRSSLII